MGDSWCCYTCRTLYRYGYWFLIGNITAGIFLGLGGGFLVMLIGMLILRVTRSTKQ